MAKKPQKTETIPAFILDPQNSVKLTLSEGWHYSFDEQTWIGPYMSRAEAEAGMAKGLEAAIAKATEITLLGGR